MVTKKPAPDRTPPPRKPKADDPVAALPTEFPPQGAHAMKRILLIDLAEREVQARAQMTVQVDSLEKMKRRPESGGLTLEQQKQLKDLKAALNSDVTVDTFFRSVAEQVARTPWETLQNGADPKYVLKYGLFGSQQIASPMGDLGLHEREIAFVCGLLQLDNRTDPNHVRFVRNVTEAQGEFQQNMALFNAAYNLFREHSVVTVNQQVAADRLSATIIGCITPDDLISIRTAIGKDGKPPPMNDWKPGPEDEMYALSTRTIAQIVRRLVADGVKANDTWLASRLESAFNLLTGSTEGAPPSSLEIDLPNLEDDVDIEIVKENLNAVQAIYFSYQLEEMRMYQVVERIVELFRQGLLPLSRGRVGDYLYKYYQKAAERITESERRDLYFRCFGAPGGNPNVGEPNRDFNELWLRFVSAVSSFARQLTVDRLLRTNVPMSVSQEQVRKAGRDLGANLSRNGYGIAYFAATEMQKSIIEFRDVLTDPDLRNVFGARDMWQVIEIVNSNYLGGPKNTHRFRTQSRAGAVIIRWIANHVQRLSNVSGEVLNTDEIANPALRALNADRKATLDPSDWDLVQACEQWLAVGGVQDASVEQYSQPIESPMGGSRPIGGMPQMARDALESAGINLPA